MPQQRLTQDQLPSQRSASQTQAQYQSPSSTTAPSSQFQSYAPPTAAPVSHPATEPASNLPPPASYQEPEQPIVTPIVAAVPVTPAPTADVDPTSAEPAVEKSANGKPLPFIRPSDIYKRMEAERERQRVSSDDTRPPLETVTDSNPTDHSSSPATFTVEHPVDAGFAVPESSRNVVTAPEPVTPQRSDFNDVGSATRDNDSKRISLSPKLPDLARMSVFGADFFSTTLTDDSAPPLPTATATKDSQEGAIEPKASLEQPSAVAVDHPVAKQSAEAPVSTASDDGLRQHNREAIPPLQTIQEPQEDEVEDEDEDDGHEQDFAPTEPLKLGKGDPSLPVFEPKPFAREATFGTDTSSPVKESDVLREEIMRTLSPVATEKSDLTSASAQGSVTENGKERQGTNDSAYTLKDYDSYWSEPNADAPPPQEAEKPAAPSFAIETVPEVEHSVAEPTRAESVAAPAEASEDHHSAAIAGAGIAGVAAVGAAAAVAAKPQPEQNVRRRFSWEASEEPAAASEIVGVNDAPPPGPVVSAAPEEHSEPKVLTEGANAPSISVVPASSTPAAPVHQQSPSVDAPRASVASDEGGAPIEREESRLSLADEKALAHESNTSLVSPTPPPESHPALAPPLQTTAPSQMSGQPAMTFREIMELGSAQDRIAKFNEARVSFATNEIGLHNWLVTMQTDHPEHASRSAPGYRPQGDTGSVGAGSGPQPAAQQPYYQQYLNASSPSSSSPTGRSRLAGLSIPSTGGSSGFGQSSNQLGAKGKEFMQSAGKMGKGLLSKGKFKLRGSGDKVFH